MSLTREERKLLHQKSQQPTFGSGKPNDDEGFNGDISYRKVEGSGTVQYLKENNSWTAISSSGEMPPIRIVSGGGGGGSSSSGVTSHNDLTSLSSDDHTQYLLIDGTRAMTGGLEGTTFDATTDFTIDGLVLTADTITNDAALTVDAAGDIILDANSGVTKFYLAGDTDDLCTLTVAANGATTIATADSDGAVGHLILDADGDIILDAAGKDISLTDGSGTAEFIFNLEAAPELDVDGAFTIDGSSTIRLDSVSNMDFYVNGRELLKFDTNGHAYLHSYDLTLYNDYKINNKSNSYHYTSGVGDYNGNYSTLTQNIVSSAFNTSYGSAL